MQITFRRHFFHKIIQTFKVYAILRKFRKNRLHFAYITLFFQVSLKDLQIFFTLARNFAQNKIFSFIIKHNTGILTHLFKNAVRQTPET